MQKKIEHFFTMTHHKTIKKCFIYDPTNHCATFEFEPQLQDVFLTIAQEIKLYLRPVTSSLPKIEQLWECTCSTSLLISNLQKAIRRRDHSAALSSTMALLHQDPTKLIRRLSIICVEDVVAIDALPVLVWMMMAHTNYQMTQADHLFMLQMVWTLCEIEVAYRCDFHKEPPTHTHQELQQEKNADVLLALHYRTMYGGMKGDMVMLKNAIEDYKTESVHPTIYKTDLTIPEEVELLMEAIDFHPLPQLLLELHKKTNIDTAVIKEMIWNAESGLNRRKKETLEQSEEYQKKEEWKQIANYIDMIRLSLI